MPYDDEDDDLDPALDRRRRQRERARARRRTLLAGGGLLLVLVLGGVGLAALLKGRSGDRGGPGGDVSGPGPLGPSPEKEGQEWSHKELRDYLASRGLKPRMESASGGGVVFIFARDRADEEDAVESAARNRRDGRMVFSYKADTIQAAKDRAGTSPADTFHWGRFIFDGESDDPRNLDAVHRALTGKPFKP